MNKALEQPLDIHVGKFNLQNYNSRVNGIN